MHQLYALEQLMQNIQPEDVLFTSCGHISRQVYYIQDRDRNFYIQGSMGATLPTAIGFALSRPDLHIHVICGDGEILMNLGTLTLLKKLQDEKPDFNLDLYILDNQCYESTGGQPTLSPHIEFRLLCSCYVIFTQNVPHPEIPRIPLSHQKIRQRFQQAIS